MVYYLQITFSVNLIGRGFPGPETDIFIPANKNVPIRSRLYNHCDWFSPGSRYNPRII